MLNKINFVKTKDYPALFRCQVNRATIVFQSSKRFPLDTACQIQAIYNLFTRMFLKKTAFLKSLR